VDIDCVKSIVGMPLMEKETWLFNSIEEEEASRREIFIKHTWMLQWDLANYIYKTKST
jgi:hypothetical protein